MLNACVVILIRMGIAFLRGWEVCVFCFEVMVHACAVVVESLQHVSVSQGQICSDSFLCCHTEMEVTDQTFYLTESQLTDTKPTSPSTDPIMLGTLQVSC